MDLRKKSEEKYIKSNEFTCQICKKEFVDPRVLPCLHCFCVECLQKLDLEQNPRTTTVKRSRNERFQEFLGGYLSEKDSSKYEYIKLNTFSNGGESNHFYESPYSTIRPLPVTRFSLKCPICHFENGIPATGVRDLPPHYLLQHRMLIQSLNKGEVCLLCDLCSSDTPAAFRCTKCLLNFCNDCSKSHKREKLYINHEIKKLKKNFREGVGITKIRRQVMCPSHSEKELKFYCSSCNMVACTECFSEFHSSHDCKSFSKAAQIYSSMIKSSLENTRMLNRDTCALIARLDALYQNIEIKYSQVQREINDHIDGYLYAFEEHRKALLNQAIQIKNGQIQTIRNRQKEVEKKAQEIEYTLKFGEELLAEGSDFEVLSFAYYLLQRLEWCVKTGTSALSSSLTNCVGTLQFLPEERAGTIKNKTVFGVVTTQVVSPSNCFITSEGLDILKNCEEKQRCDLTLVTKDSFDQRLRHGAEGIEVDLKCINGKRRVIPIYIVDQQNGLYSISFTPDTSGKMNLSVSIRGIPIKGSPFMVNVRPRRIHKGKFHCCSFCSSGGDKSAVCGCGGRMPGGYQGCGHGYSGHPGGNHWSCCGNTLHKSECLRSVRNDGFYQLKL